MAEATLNSLDNKETSEIWTTAKIHYVFYYSLYSLMLRIGVTSEIHSCSLEFMRKFLVPPYTKEDTRMIMKAFDNRNRLQYYTDRPVSQEEIEQTRDYCKGFYLKTKNILKTAKLSQIKIIRDKLAARAKS